MKVFILRREIPAGDNDKLHQQGYADWQHIASHLQRGIPAVALTEQSALSSAVANDLAADMVFAQQVYGIGRPGDVLMGLSTSGNSKNVVKALKVARAFGVKTIGFTGSTPCQMDELCDIVLKAPATETYMVQEYHLPLYHAICAAVEQVLFG
jgi:D-sedoheptulose 7-phosphate isomerase